MNNIVFIGFAIATLIALMLFVSGGDITLFFLFVVIPSGFIGCVAYALGGGIWSIVAAFAVLVINSFLKRVFVHSEIGNMHDLEKDNGESALNLREQINSAGIVARSMRDRPWDTKFVQEYLRSIPAKFRPTDQQIQAAIEQASKDGRIYYRLNTRSGKFRPTKDVIVYRQFDMLSKYLREEQEELGLTDEEVNNKLYHFYDDQDQGGW